MKRSLNIVGFLLFILALSSEVNAQLFKKLSDKVSGKIGNVSTHERANTQEEVGSLPMDYRLAVTGSGPDIHLQYHMQMDTKTRTDYQMDITMEMYVSPGKGGRSEINMEMPVIGPIRMATLSDFRHPDQVILLNERKKQYFILNFSDKKETVKENFKVTHMGQDILHGLSCIHGKATGPDGQTFEFWTTRDIPGYEALLEVYSKSGEMGSDQLWKSMKESGTAGLLVKLLVPNSRGNSTMELTRIERTTVPASLIEIPSDYKESNGGWVKRFQKQLNK